MHFPYRRIHHQMETMHVFIEFIFFEVWCKAPSTEYDVELFRGNPDLYSIINDLCREDLAGKLKGSGKDFYECVNSIYNDFKSLTDVQIQEYQRHFRANNNVKDLCAGGGTWTPVTYLLLTPPNPILNKKLETFFSKLYSSGFLGLKNTSAKIGTLKDYYREFVKTNDEGVCPFCGIYILDGVFDETRDAFDHYLPSSKYPFNSINLSNLAPSCSKCNSGYKLDEDPLHDKSGKRRKAFYPFAENQSEIEITITIAPGKWDRLEDKDINIQFGPSTLAEEIETWDELFHVRQRYAALCCYKSGGKSWLNRIFVECKNYSHTPYEMFQAELETCKENRWVELRFLRKPFLEGCDRAGLFPEPKRIWRRIYDFFISKNQLPA